MVRSALVTGGCGFIGSWLTEALLDDGWAVHVIDDLSTGSIRNVDAVAGHKRFSCCVGSVADRELMHQLVERADAVFHLAAAVGVRLIVEQPVRTISTNIRTTEVVLELCAAKRKPVVIASSSEVYGKLNRPSFREEDDLVLGPTTRARWCYAGTKIIDEFLAQAYFHEHGVPAVCARLFNTIGPRQTGRYGMVVPRFVAQALAGEPITVYGTGTQRRSFTWVGDVVGALIALAEHPEAPGGVFNVGHTKDISIHELALLVKELAGSGSPIVLVPYDEAYATGFEDMARRLPDIARLQALTGYAPTLDLPEMLRRLIAHARGEEVRTASSSASPHGVRG